MLVLCLLVITNNISYNILTIFDGGITWDLTDHELLKPYCSTLMPEVTTFYCYHVMGQAVIVMGRLIKEQHGHMFESTKAFNVFLSFIKN